MKKITIMILLILIPAVLAVDVPKEPDTVVINKIDQEHKNTRQFISNELKKREAEIVDEFTKRADYYEESFKSTMNSTVLKLGTFWAGILLFFVSFQRIIIAKTEKKRYQVLKEALKKDIVDEFRTEHFVLPEKEIAQVQEFKKKEEKRGLFSKKKPKNIIDKMKGVLVGK